MKKLTLVAIFLNIVMFAQIANAQKKYLTGFGITVEYSNISKDEAGRGSYYVTSEFYLHDEKTVLSVFKDAKKVVEKIPTPQGELRYAREHSGAELFFWKPLVSPGDNIIVLGEPKTITVGKKIYIVKSTGSSEYSLVPKE